MGRSINASLPGAVQSSVTSARPTGSATVPWHLYRDWLPESGEELRDFPLFFHYVKKVPDVPEHEQVTDVFLPLK